MKHKGCKCCFANARNTELLRACYKIIVDSSEYIRINDIFRMVVDMPASRFWVSEERAAIVVAAMIRGEKLPRMSRNKTAMYREIYRRYVKLSKEYPNKTLGELVAMVVHQPAPKFYITPKSAKTLIYYARRKSKEQGRNEISSKP